jgi:hypothetical protein
LLDSQHASYFLPASSYTASDILTKLKTVDGPGSGLDADTVDGATPSAIGGTANAIIKARPDGRITPQFLPFGGQQGTFQVPKLVDGRNDISNENNIDFLNLSTTSGGAFVVECGLSLSDSDQAVYMLPNASTANGLSDGMITNSNVDHSHIVTNYAFMIANTLYSTSHGTTGICYGTTYIYPEAGKRRVSTSHQSSSGTNLVNLSVTSHWTDSSSPIGWFRVWVPSGTSLVGLSCTEWSM